MPSTNVGYKEDDHTLKAMVELLGSEELLREIQKHGMMLPEIVKFGSEEIEIYSLFDRRIGEAIKDNVEVDHFGLFHAITLAQQDIDRVYYMAHVGTRMYTEVEGEGVLGEPMPEVHRKKLFTLGDLLQAIGISEEHFNEIDLHLGILPVTLLIPGMTLKYYFEDDYLQLRYVLTLISQGRSLEEAAEQADSWVRDELW